MTEQDGALAGLRRAITRKVRAESWLWGVNHRDNPTEYSRAVTEYGQAGNALNAELAMAEELVAAAVAWRRADKHGSKLGGYAGTVARVDNALKALGVEA